MDVNLTAGAIPMLSSGDYKDLKPVVQITDIRIVQTQTKTVEGESKERYRFLLSDGTYQQQGMLATQLNDLVRSQQFQKGSVVQLTEFVCNQIRDRTIIIIINLNLIKDKCDIIGDPKLFSRPSVVRYTAPMQSSQNQPAAPRVTLPNANEGSPVQTHNSEHNAGKRLRSYVNETSAAAPMQCSIKQAAATVLTMSNTRVEGGIDDRPITHQEYKELISEIRKSNNKLDTIFTFLKKALGFTIVLSVLVASIPSSQIFSSFRG